MPERPRSSGPVPGVDPSKLDPALGPDPDLGIEKPPPRAATPEPARPATTVNLDAAAELCVDLARVIDASDVPALLARAAAVLDARGIIVWVADSAGIIIGNRIAMAILNHRAGRRAARTE